MITTPSIKLLRYIVDKDGVHTAPSKIEAMVTYPSPTDQAAVHTAIGTFSYYCSFIKDFAKITTPINATLRQDVAFKWTPKAEEAFQILKRKLMTAPILARLILDKLLILQIDACSTGLGAILSQLQPIHNENGEIITDKFGKKKMKEVIISYASAGTDKHQ